MRRLPGVLLAAALVVTGACNGDDSGDTAPVATGRADCTGDMEMDVYSTEGEGVVHTDHPSYRGPLGNPPRYTVNPPSGGDHLTPSVGPGVYEGDNVPPDGVLVHSLEHGYVILWFRPDASAAHRKAIDSAQDDFRRDVIVVERAGMSVPVAATAWGRRLLCEGADAGALADFVEERRNQAPEKIPH